MLVEIPLALGRAVRRKERMTDIALAIAVSGPWDAVPLWAALRAAGALDGGVEVHLACDHPPATGIPATVTVHTAKELSLFRLWGLAIAQSSAPHVAILHAHGLPTAGWLEAMRGALGTATALCGPVEPNYPPTDSRIIGYLVEYCQFHRPRRRVLDEVPGSNLVLARGMLASPEILRRDGFSKTSLLAAGLIAPRWVDEAIIAHDRPFAFWAFCLRRLRHGRAYGATRLASPGAPPRSLAITFTIVLPFVRVARIFRNAWRHAGLRSALIYRFPAILLAETFWSAGEFAGYATLRSGDASRVD